jgi:hypothetical protein
MTANSIGGIASKLGNGYEAKWLVWQLLDVVQGRARSIQFEGITASFAGFEAAVQKGAVTEWHQTKINAPHGNWTVPALDREGVLSAFARRLSGSTTDRCIFVSQDLARDAGAMSNKACRANEVGEFIRSLSKKEREAYDKLKDNWAVTDATMLLWLKRCSFLTVPIPEIDSYIETIGSLLFDGRQLFGALRVYLEERFNKLLTTELVHQEFLNYNGVRLKHWQLDPTLIERIKAENDSYLAGHAVPGSKKNHIERRETKALVDLLTQDSGPAVILLSGVAGAGKSRPAIRIRCTASPWRRTEP